MPNSIRKKNNNNLKINVEIRNEGCQFQKGQSYERFISERIERKQKSIPKHRNANVKESISRTCG